MTMQEYLDTEIERCRKMVKMSYKDTDIEHWTSRKDLLLDIKEKINRGYIVDVRIG